MVDDTVTLDDEIVAVRRLIEFDETQYQAVKHLCDDEAIAGHDRDAAALRSALARLEASRSQIGGAKIIAGLREAVQVTKLANAILDLLPPEVVTKELHSRIISMLACPPAATSEGGEEKKIDWSGTRFCGSCIDV